jgi:hypothetical protein
LYGAAILAPIILGLDGGGRLSEFQATNFRILVEQKHRDATQRHEAARASGNAEEERRYDLLRERYHHIADAYDKAVRDGKLNDIIESSYGKKASELSDAELQTAVQEITANQDSDYQRATLVLGQIERNIDPFIELYRAFREIEENIAAPASIHSSVRQSGEHFERTDDFDRTVAVFDRAQGAIMRVINETMDLTPEEALQITQGFIQANQGNLSPEAQRLEQKIRIIAERVFGYQSPGGNLPD